MNHERPPSIERRIRDARRAREAHRRLQIFRRANERLFRASLSVVPHVFLRPEAIRHAPLLAPPEKVIEALRPHVVWTLDTACRLAFGIGLLAQADLTCYAREAQLEALVDAGMIEPLRTGAISLTPLHERAPLLIAQVVDALPRHESLPEGDRVVTPERLERDLLGTLGYRPDLLARLEAARERNARGERQAAGGTRRS